MKTISMIHGPLLNTYYSNTNDYFPSAILQLQQLVPVHQFDKLPSYFIFAGLVFVPLTQPYLHEYGEDWYNTSPRRLCERALRELPKKAGEQLVILSQVLHLPFELIFHFICAIVLPCVVDNLNLRFLQLGDLDG